MDPVSFPTVHRAIRWAQGQGDEVFLGDARTIVRVNIENVRLLGGEAKAWKLLPVQTPGPARYEWHPMMKEE